MSKKSVNASRMIGLLVLVMAAIVALSGPVAEVLDPGSEPVAEAKKKHKKKKKKKKKPFPFNVVQCPTEGEDSSFCFGTPANDFLIGGPPDRPFGEFDRINGGEGNDVYNGGDGSDGLVDESTTSSDAYLFPATDFSAGAGNVFLTDKGSDSDLVGLSSYSVLDFEVFRAWDDLSLVGPGERFIGITDFFTQGKIETFLFREGSFTGVQCPTEGEDDIDCFGTAANDFLIGGPADRPSGAFDFIRGGEGTDVYNGGNGSDQLFDGSTTSSDVYLFPSTEFSAAFGKAFMRDSGSSNDIVGLSSYSVLDFDVTRSGDQLFLDGPGKRDVEILGFFAQGKIEAFSFREGSFTGDQIAGRATNATAEEEAALKERPSEEELSSREAAKQEDASS